MYGARQLLNAVLLSFILSGGAIASPWTRADNEFLVISRADYFKADLQPVNTPDGFVDSQFQRIESNTYAEFGVTDDVMIGAKAVYGTTWLTRGADTETATGFSEVEGFGQYQFLRSGRDAGSIRIAAAVPANFSSGVRPALQADGVDIDISALYGRNIYDNDFKVFSSIEGGFRKRTGNAADHIRLQSTIGVEPDAQWLFLLETFATVSLRNEELDGADFDVVRIQPSILWRFSNRWGLQAGAAEEIAGRNIALGRTFFIGLWSRF
ncbi:MAG: hypothetical protein AAFX54_12670 [Pseudomonadota bacterium]